MLDKPGRVCYNKGTKKEKEISIMTKWELYAWLVMVQTNSRKECVKILSSLLNISTWEAERLIDQVNFKKSLDNMQKM